MIKHNLLLLTLVAVTRVFPQPTEPFLPDTTTRALWHFEDSTGTIIHDWVGGNHGTAVGTTVIPGRFGFGRSFNGTDSYVSIPSNASFDFGEYSFKIDVWFKTTTAADMIIIRRGLAPEPGFMISIRDGHLYGLIGNRGDSRWPDTLLTLISDFAYHDNAWHLVTLHRDRSVSKLFLYVDGNLATQPINDPITFPIVSTRPMTIGRWENSSYPIFFTGSIDEVRISCASVLYRPAVSVDIQPHTLEFGTLVCGTSDSLFLTIGNNGYSDSLRVFQITSSNASFACAPTIQPIPPYGSVRLAVTYTPAIAGHDTGSIVRASNDLRMPLFSVPVSGRAIGLSDRPIILGIFPLNYSQARLIWFRSVFDTTGSADPVTEYSIWRRVSGSRLSAANGTSTPACPLSLISLDPLWQFVMKVPAMRFNRYAAEVARVFDTPYNVFVVAAHTSNRSIFISPPDSIMQYPVTAIDRPLTELTPSEVDLGQNYPNPFNPSTTIRFGLPQKSAVLLTVFNTLGQLISVLQDEEQEAGYHEVKFDATGLPSGVYFYRLQAGNFVSTKRLLLLR